MKEQPILFNDEMVRAILDGRKTQTRGPVTPIPQWEELPGRVHQAPLLWAGRYRNANSLGRPGVEVDTRRAPWAKGLRLYVRECFSPHYFGHRKPGYRADWDAVAAANNDIPAPKWTPSIHMPRWASRITLEVERVWVERVQDMTRLDMAAEGWPMSEEQRETVEVVKALNPPSDFDGMIDDAAIEWFADVWDTIYAQRGLGWDSNPWVWCCEFKAVEK